MARFIYGNGDATVLIDDRTLLHVQRAIEVKLRRGESFMFNLHARHLPSGQGSLSVWMSAAVPVAFDYRGGNWRGRLNPTWVELLVAEASHPDGLSIVPEPELSLADLHALTQA